MNVDRRDASAGAVSLGARQQAMLAAFEDAWQRGEQPRLVDFAPAADDLPLLIELIRIDLRRRLDAGEDIRVESYLGQWSDLAADAHATLDLIVAESALRRRSDASIRADEYLGRFPQHAAALTVALEPERGAEGDGTRTDAERSLSETADLDPSSGIAAPPRRPSQADDFADVPLPDVPGYEVIRRIARGGMGEVLEARHRVLNRTVAVKMPLAHLIAGEADRERFLREARSAAQLRHPSICAIHEIGQFGGCPYIIMDFVRGQTLKDWRKGREPTARQAAELVAVLARAVAYAHERGVIHRDLKPSNVLVETESGAPVLTDFGLAKQLDDNSSQLTHSGQVMGTPAYMAPEQAAGHVDRVGPLSDVYSLGAVLYELLSGRPPFAGNVGEVLRQVQTDEPPSPRTINPRVHRDLETVCLKALAKDPAARYGSASALAEDLERFGAGEPILARRIGPMQRLARSARRRPAMTAAIVAVAASLASAAWLAVKTRGNVEMTRLNQSFEAGLDQGEWTPEHLERMEGLVAKLAPHSATDSASARARLYQRYAEFHHALLRKATLDADDAARVEQALAILQNGAAELAPGLRQALEERKSGWDTVVDLRAGAPLGSIFAEGAAVVDGERFVHPKPKGPQGEELLVYTTVASPGRIELEAVFDDAWREAGELGLALNASPGDSATKKAKNSIGAAGYFFRLRATVRNIADEDVPAAGQKATFSKAAANDGELVVEIFRGDAQLARRTIPASQAAAGPLRLFAARNANRLSMQVNELPPLVFEDVFPLSRARPGVFAVLWPLEAGLKRLHGRRQALPAAASPLERGDEAYGRGALSEALQAYRQEAIASVGTSAAQEARFKEAMCLAALNRPEAPQHLERLAVEKGDRWPLLAACELWLTYMRNRRFDEGDAIYESLSGRYRFEQLAALIPSELRQEILDAYGNQARSFSFYSYDPKRLSHLQRAIDVETLLGSSGYASYGSRFHLLRSLHAAGRIEEALELAESMVGEDGPWRDDPTAANWVEEQAWLLCLQGRAEEALDCLDRLVFERPGEYRKQYAWLLLARTRVLAALGRWEEAERDLDAMVPLLPSHLGAPHLPVLCLVRGMLRQRRGDEAGALEAWRAGFEPENLELQTGSDFLANLILASLTGDVTDQQAEKLTAFLLHSFGRDSALSAAKDAIRLPPSVLREMWRTPRGRDVARKIAFREVSMEEHVRLPALLMATETAHQSAFGGQWSDEQEELIWNLMGETYALQYAGKLSAAQALSLAMTWKGMTNFLGWDGLAPTLEPGHRGALAYLLAHRYLALNKRDEVLRFFQTALADSAPETALHRLARQEAEQFGSN